MAERRAKWRVMAGLATAGCLAVAGIAQAQFTSFNDRARTILEGNWQSCREADDEYAERIYDGNLPGVGPFELHMGPYHEFALFRGVQDGHRDHASTANLFPENPENPNRNPFAWTSFSHLRGTRKNV